MYTHAKESRRTDGQDWTCTPTRTDVYVLCTSSTTLPAIALSPSQSTNMSEPGTDGQGNGRPMLTPSHHSLASQSKPCPHWHGKGRLAWLSLPDAQVE